jgi:hypothetical protein
MSIPAGEENLFSDTKGGKMKEENFLKVPFAVPF